MTEPIARGLRLPERHIDSVSMDRVSVYLAVSGDDNPIHTDLASAQRAGLPERPVPGMMVMAMLGRLVDAWPPSLVTRKLSARFVAPVFVGGDLVLSGRVAAIDQASNRAVLRLVASQSGKLCVLGEAEIVLHDESEDGSG